MAKVTITLKDEKGGVVGCSVEFDPPCTDTGTPAQIAATQMLGEAMKRAKSHSRPKVTGKRRRGPRGQGGTT